jgi:hypothetical protein
MEQPHLHPALEVTLHLCFFFFFSLVLMTRSGWSQQ